MNKLVLLLTGSINQLKGLPFTNLIDPDVRKQQYIESIKFYVNSTDLPIVFVENTGNDISAYFQTELSRGRLEILIFTGNNFEPRLGKGVGEFECIKFAIPKSKLISNADFVFKITGRYQLNNLNKFINQWRRNKIVYVMSNTNFLKAYTDTRFIGFNPNFINNYLEIFISQLNDSEGIYLEHI